MTLIAPIIRPPSEADSFLLQVTTGCSANTCSFCGAYLDKPFAIKNVDEIYADIESARNISPPIRRVFLLDGDAVAIPDEKLLPILEKLQVDLPSLSRVASYANGYNVTRRSLPSLKALSAHKLKLIYIGLESGSQNILERCHKKSRVEEMIEAVQKAQKAGIKASVIVLLGLGGKKYSEEHVAQTIIALNRMQPRYLSFLSLMVVPGTPLAEDVVRGQFQELDSMALLKEAKNILEGLTLSQTIFRANHASNYLSLEGRLPKDKARLICAIDTALVGETSLRPESFRGL